jgi:predicted nucleotidyltransferase component of viral defense system
MNIDYLEKIKRLTISALVSDDLLMGILVLKGGNALNIAYEISSRGSIDIDFSIEKDFTEAEIDRIRNQIEFILNQEFSRAKLIVFDTKLSERPQKMDDSVKEFWGGYLLEFKIVESHILEKHGNDIENLRRNALKIRTNNSTVFTVDISKYEYIGHRKLSDINGSTFYVYSPEMIVLEKLRAICQQLPDYKKVVARMSSKARARDFYDIHNMCTHFNLDFYSNENIELAKTIFGAKRVPLNYLNKLGSQFELHNENWISVVQTVDPDIELDNFEYYFQFVVNGFSHLADY